MEIEIGGGVVIDLASKSDVDKSIRAAMWQYFKIPNKMRRKGSVLLPTPVLTTNTAVIDLGGPVAGRQWEVKKVWVSGLDPTAAFTGRGLLVVGEGAISGNPIDPASTVDTLATLPGTWTYSADQVIVLNNEHLYVIISGATQGTMAVANAQVIDAPALAEEDYLRD